MCIQLLLVSVLLIAFVSPFSSSREFSGFTLHQGSPEIKSLYFHETRKMSAEYNLYNYIYTGMKTWPCYREGGYDRRLPFMPLHWPRRHYKS